MLFPDFGVVAFLVSFVIVSLSLAIPIGIIYLLVIIYRKLHNIEELIKKDSNK
jgi:hypothetical protein